MAPFSLEFVAARLPKHEMFFDFCEDDVYSNLKRALLGSLNYFGKTRINASFFPLIKGASGSGETTMAMELVKDGITFLKDIKVVGVHFFVKLTSESRFKLSKDENGKHRVAKAN